MDTEDQTMVASLMGESAAAAAGVSVRPSFFSLEVAEEAWIPVDFPADGSAGGDFPESILGVIDLHDYFWGQLDAAIVYDSDAFSVLAMRLAPDFTIPRHHHNSDELAMVVEGEARQGNRVFGPGDAFFTPAGSTYSLAAGPKGCRVIEIRKESLLHLTTTWVESDPVRWRLPA